jgi:hypothetical protein
LSSYSVHTTVESATLPYNKRFGLVDMSKVTGRKYNSTQRVGRLERRFFHTPQDFLRSQYQKQKIIISEWTGKT